MNLKTIINNKVIKAGSWYTITNFLIKGLSFITIPIFTRLLTTEDYGFFSLYSAWVAILTILISLSLTESIRRAKFDYSSNFDDFVTSITFLSVIIFLLIFLTVIIFGDVFQSITSMTKSTLYIMLFHSFFSYIKNLAITKFRMEYNYKVISIISIIVSVLQIVLSVYLIVYVFHDKRWIGRIIGNASLVILVGSILLFYLLHIGKKFISFEYWKYALLLSVPLILHNLSGIINTQFDRIIINSYVGESATGLYSFAYNIGMIIQVIYISMDQAWFPWFFEKMERKEYVKIKHRANQYMLVFTFVYFFVLMLSPELVRVMASKDYWSGLNILPFIFMAYYFRAMYGFEVSVEYSEKRTDLISVATLLSALLNIALNFIFVPKYGYVAAAITTTVSYFVLFIFHFFVTSRILKLNLFGLKFHFKYLLFGTSITTVFILLKDSTILRLSLLVLVSIICLYKVYQRTQGFKTSKI